MSRSENYYAILEVNRSADLAAIRRAYAKQIKRYPPDGPAADPEMFKRVREAYETLRDSDSRRQYDTVGSLSDEIQALILAGQKSLHEDEEYDVAILSFRQALHLDPNLTFVRNLLGLAMLYLGDPALAIDQFTLCIKDEPGNAAYHGNASVALRDLKRYEEAIRAAEQAIQLAPEDSDQWVGLAQIYIKQSRYDDALRALDRAISLDGQLDFGDFTALFAKVEVCILNHNMPLLEATLNQIETVLPAAESSRDYVAYRFAGLAETLIELGANDEARRVAVRARKLAPTDPAILRQAQMAEALATAGAEFERLKADSAVPHGLKTLSLLYLTGSKEASAEEFEQVYQEALYDLHDTPLDEMKRGLARFGSAYKSCWALNAPFYLNLHQAVS